MNPGSKKLNEMNRLGDMGHFPVAVNAGATMNILLTLLATWWIEPRLPASWAPVAWTALVLALNLLRSTYPAHSRMNFWHDQHKFSDWVYVAASANMAFWVLTGWAVFSAWHTTVAMGSLLAIAFFATFSPVLLRRLQGQPR